MIYRGTYMRFIYELRTTIYELWKNICFCFSRPVLGQQYSYAYDPIGNRTAATLGAPSTSSAYTANNLNQYTSRTVPDTFAVIGDTPLDVDIYVNGEEADRQGTYWYSCITVNNVPSAVYAEIETLGIFTPPDPQDPPEYTITTNHVFVAQSPETFTYDLDGNMTSDSRFTYTWNGENRLICAETRNDLPPSVPRHRIEYAYDHQGRMVSKVISRATTNNYELITNNCYTWDGWNIIAEKTIVNCTLSTVNSYYVWGLDLSGTLQGAGGVGGLLAVVNTNGVFAPAYDANGNISEYVTLLTTEHCTLSTGDIAAHYEYDPFGNTTVQSGELSQTFTFRFSTKPFCAITGLVYYPKRPFSPPLGRWITKDPINEKGGLSLYGFCKNNAVSKWDAFGLSVTDKINYLGDLDAGSLAEKEREHGYPKIINGKIFYLNGMFANGDFEAKWDCQNCGNSECQTLYIIEDTVLTGEVFWRGPGDGGVPDWSLLRLSGKGHEMWHVDNLIDAAQDFDGKLHSAADARCVLSDCCQAKMNFLEIMRWYYKYLTGKQDAWLDTADYGAEFSNTPARNQETEALILGLVNEAESNMSKKCHGQ